MQAIYLTLYISNTAKIESISKDTMHWIKQYTYKTCF